MRRGTTAIGAMMLKKHEANGMICGTVSTTAAHLRYIDSSRPVLAFVTDRRFAVNSIGYRRSKYQCFLVPPAESIFN
ncbi:Phosphate acetyl/butaryl transferase [Cupriavidus sp. YR651]|nr:Phosphate acetyl/butaryl transferase [Cupriavidus sp. YR651]